MITIEQGTTSEIRQRLVLAARTLADWTPFFDAWHDVWVGSRLEMFATSGDSTDTPWPMYSRTTREHQYAAVKSRLLGRRLSRADLLMWTPGRERLSPSMYDKSHPEHVFRSGPRSATFGTIVPYARNHNEGVGSMPKWAGGHPIPRRELLGLGSRLVQDTRRLVGRFAAIGVSNLDDSGKARAGLSTADVYALLAQAGRA